jgi:DNA replication protein DnaC
VTSTAAPTLLPTALVPEEVSKNRRLFFYSRKLDALGLFGMVLGLREQLEQSHYTGLSFDERFGLLVDREAEARDSRRLALRLKAAKLRQEATVEDLDFRTPRGLDKSVVRSLAQAGWVANHHNLLISGPTGAGKSFLACALTHAAVRRGHTALYVRTPRLLAELALSRGDGRYVRRLGQLARIGVLVLDDFLLTPPNVVEAKDLLEVIDDRSQVRSTLVVSQLPVEAWHPALAGGDPTLADAILDRLVHHAHRLTLAGASMRRRQPPTEEHSVA